MICCADRLISVGERPRKLWPAPIVALHHPISGQASYTGVAEGDAMISLADFSKLEDAVRWGALDATRQAQLMAELAARPELARYADEDGATLLMVAAHAGNLEAVTLLCRQGADPKAVNLSGENALTSAVQGALDEPVDNRPGIVKVLIAHGADPNQAGEQGCNALHWAVIHGLPELVQALLEGGGDPAVCIDDRPGSGVNVTELAASSRCRGRPEQRKAIQKMLADKLGRRDGL